MQTRGSLLSRCLCVVVATIFASLFAPAHGQAPYSPPRTADGHPDLQGIWGMGFMTSLERPPFAKTLAVSADEATKLAAKYLSFTPEVVDPDANFITDFPLGMVRGEYRSSMLIEPADGQLPFTKKALGEIAKYSRRETSYANPEDRSTVERCIIGLGQAPIRPQHGFVPMQVVQTPSYIVLMTEDVGGLRIIDMTGHAPPDTVRSYEGYAAGHWEGDTLVIETTHLRADDPIREHFDRPMVVGPNSKIVERFTRASDTELVQQFTIIDPDLYARPWMAEFSQTRSDKQAYEYACHEWNYSLTNILRAARMGLQDKPEKKR